MSWLRAPRPVRGSITRTPRTQRSLAMLSVHGLVVSGLVPVATVAAGAAAVTAVSAAVAPAPAKASLSGTVLILSTSVNGGSSSKEAQAASGLGLTVTVATPATWDAMTQAQFAAYNAIVIGDPSAASCSATVPSDALSTAGTWGPAVNGNVAVLGTAPALAGATTLISDAIAYAASSGSGKTGLYVSLNCEYSTASAGAAVPLLADVEGGGFAVTGQGSNCPSDAGTVNTWQVLALTQFNGLTSSKLGPWSSPACSVEETFNAWPAGLGGLGYYGNASPATFTASDGATGQAYLLAGAPAGSATAELSPSTGGQVPAGATTGGNNPAAPGLSQATAADPVNTENGDFTESASDVSVPTFGPSLNFTRTYDAQVAQAQTKAGTPGPMGYGWTDNWATSLSSAKPVPGGIYTMDGMRSSGLGGPPTSVALQSPGDVFRNGSNWYIADTAGNRVLEVAGTTGTQWGIPMTAGDTYLIAGSSSGIAGRSPDGTQAASSLLNGPQGLAMDASGNLFIADSLNNRVIEIAAATGSQRGGTSMTADDIYTVAGHQSGGAGHSGDGGLATAAFLWNPAGLAIRPGAADLYIADSGNSRVQEVPAASGSQWGQSMTAWDIYTVAGSSAGNFGTSGNGTAASSALLSSVASVSLSSANDMYIADTGNNRIIEVPQASGTQWGISMTANAIYTVAGSQTGASGSSGDGGVATSAKLNTPQKVIADNGTQLYIADAGNNKIREVARSAHSEWGQSMTANDMYTIAGTGTAGFSGDGGAATSAQLSGAGGLGLDASFNLFIADTANNRVREVSASAFAISEFAGTSWKAATAGNAGPAIGAGLQNPNGVATDASGNIYVADTANQRIQEIAASDHTQWGITMTAGDVYTVAGHAHGDNGFTGDGGPATAAKLSLPDSIAVDSSGNLYIADTMNHCIREVAAANHTQWGIAMTANDIYTIAGTPPTGGHAGDAGPATSAQLAEPWAVAIDASGDLFIADFGNNRIQEIAATSGTQYGISMTAGDIYTITGSAAGTSGNAGDSGIGTSALLSNPTGIAVDSRGDVYIADYGNSRIQELYGGGQSWGQQMTNGHIYTIAGQPLGPSGTAGDAGPASAAYLNAPVTVALDASGNLYITDSGNNRIQEIAAVNGIQWGQQMQAGYVYTVAGSATGASGFAGDGGQATTARLNQPYSIAVDPSGNLYVTDYQDNRLREVVSATGTPFLVYPTPGSTVNGVTSAGGITITQDDGSLVTFYPVQNGCSAPYTATVSGQYCTLPENIGSNLSYSSGTYTFTPQPGETQTYNSAGQLTGQADAAGDALTVAYGTPLPGAGNCPSAATWCQLVTSASGRALTIGYNAANLVTSVTDPMGRTWTYGYASSDLTSVSDPMTPANVTSYTYGSGSTGNPLNANDLLTITSPNAQPGGPDAGDSTVNVYDSSGRVARQTDPMGNTTAFAYNVNASTGTGTTTTTDPDGNTTVDAYLQGSLIAESDWTGGTTLAAEMDHVPAQTAAGNGAGSQLNLAMDDGDGNITTFTYDGAGNPVTITSLDGASAQPTTSTRQFTTTGGEDCSSTPIAAQTCQQSGGPAPVAPGGVITPPASVPPQGEDWALFDAFGNELYTTSGVYEPGSNTAAYAQTTYKLYKGNSITLNGKNVTCTAVPPSASLPCATIDENGVVTQLAYDPAGDLTSTSTPDGNGADLATTTYAYDGDGEQTAVTSPDGNLAGANTGNYTTATVYNSDGAPTSVTRGGGNGHTVTPRVINYGYDASGNQTTVQDARGYTTTTTYNADDQATLVTSPDNNATLTCYDGDGHIAQTVPAIGVAANSLTPRSCPAAYPGGYDPATNKLAADAIMFTYDGAGQRVTMYSPAPSGQSGYETTSYAYDGAGQLTKTTAPSSTSGGQAQVTTDTYNADGELASETTGYGTSAASTISYCYDPNGNRTSVVYADGNISGVAQCESSYPWVVSATAYPTQAAYQTTSSYDSAGELVLRTTPATAAAPAGAATTATYDPAGNTLTRTDPNGVTATWTYTPLDDAASVSYSGSSAHSVSYGYDANGDLTSMADASGSSSYVWDPFSELTSATNGAGKITGYNYDADGNVTTIAYPLPGTASWASTDNVTYAYDNADQMTSVTDFNNKQISIGSTADGQPNSASLAATGDTIATTYDNTDAASSITVKNGSNTLLSFTYADGPDGTILKETDTPASSLSPAVYNYDAKGRVISMTQGTGTSLNYGFDASGNLTTLPGGAAGTYDHDGELTSGSLSGTTTSYTYDADGHRLAVKQGSTSIATATWNGAGQLTSYSSPAASMTAAAYDGNGRRTSATTGAGTANYTWNDVSTVPRLIMDSANAYIYGPGTSPLEQVNLSTGAITYLVADSLGSVRGVLSSTGTLTASTSYDAWGNPETSGGLTATTPFGFAGGYTDADGLIYLLNRYYDPATGQFISVDPAIDQTLQPYEYANDNPVSLTDPTGLEWLAYGTRIFGCLGFCKTDWFDYSMTVSAKMDGEIEKIEKAGKLGEKVAALIGGLVSILTAIITKHQAQIVISSVAFVLIVAGLTVRKWIGLVSRLFRRSPGRHTKLNGFYEGAHFVSFSGWSWANGAAPRKCPHDRLKCGSPGFLDWRPKDGRILVKNWE